MRTLPVILPDPSAMLGKVPFSRIILEKHAGALIPLEESVCSVKERYIQTDLQRPKVP